MFSDRPEKGPETLTDRGLVDYLRRAGSCTIGELVEFAGVTSTAIRQRLNRLMEQGLVERVAERAGRGRPTHRYSLSRSGERSAGNNFEDLAGILWSEIRKSGDTSVYQSLISKIVDRMSEAYRGQINGSEIVERMESLVKLMAARDIPFEVRENAEGLPVLVALACPYPDLAEKDRGICAMEKSLLAELLGDGLRMRECRLDGAVCCTFEAAAAAPPVA